MDPNPLPYPHTPSSCFPPPDPALHTPHPPPPHHKPHTPPRSSWSKRGCSRSPCRLAMWRPSFRCPATCRTRRSLRTCVRRAACPTTSCGSPRALKTRLTWCAAMGHAPWRAGCLMCSLPHVQPASCVARLVCCLPHVLPASGAAYLMCCLPHVQPASRAACLMCCLPHARPHSPVQSTSEPSLPVHQPLLCAAPLPSFT